MLWVHAPWNLPRLHTETPGTPLCLSQGTQSSIDTYPAKVRANLAPSPAYTLSTTACPNTGQSSSTDRAESIASPKVSRLLEKVVSTSLTPITTQAHPRRPPPRRHQNPAPSILVSLPIPPSNTPQVQSLTMLRPRLRAPRLAASSLALRATINSRRSLHLVPQLKHDFAETGVPDLMSPAGFQIAWADYQGLVVEKLNALTAGRL